MYEQYLQALKFSIDHMTDDELLWLQSLVDVVGGTDEQMVILHAVLENRFGAEILERTTLH